MLKIPVLHPEILAALGQAGHLSKVLISDGNFPHINRTNPRAKIVWANFKPGVIGAVTALEMVCDLVPVEEAIVMEPARTGEHGMTAEPPVWELFRKTLKARAGFEHPLLPLPKPPFVEHCLSPDLCLVIATAETQIWANCMITIGVVK